MNESIKRINSLDSEIHAKITLGDFQLNFNQCVSFFNIPCSISNRKNTSHIFFTARNYQDSVVSQSINDTDF